MLQRRRGVLPPLPQRPEGGGRQVPHPSREQQRKRPRRPRHRRRSLGHARRVRRRDSRRARSWARMRRSAPPGASVLANLAPLPTSAHPRGARRRRLHGTAGVRSRAEAVGQQQHRLHARRQQPADVVLRPRQPRVARHALLAAANATFDRATATGIGPRRPLACCRRWRSQAPRSAASTRRASSCRTRFACSTSRAQHRVSAADGRSPIG